MAPLGKKKHFAVNLQLFREAQENTRKTVDQIILRQIEEVSLDSLRASDVADDASGMDELRERLVKSATHNTV